MPKTINADLLRTHLLALSSAYCAATGKSTATVSEHATGNWKFFDHIRENGFNVDMYDKAMKFFVEQWPKGTAWPAKVPRPKVTA